MKQMKIGLLSAMLIAMLAAFATPKPAISYYKKPVNTTSCQATNCTPIVTTACSELNMDYFESNSAGTQLCFKRVTLYLP